MCSKLFDTKLNFEMRKNKKTLADWLHEFMNYILVFFLRFLGKKVLQRKILMKKYAVVEERQKNSLRKSSK